MVRTLAARSDNTSLSINHPPPSCISHNSCILWILPCGFKFHNSRTTTKIDPRLKSLTLGCMMLENSKFALDKIPMAPVSHACDFYFHKKQELSVTGLLSVYQKLKISNRQV